MSLRVLADDELDHELIDALDQNDIQATLIRLWQLAKRRGAEIERMRKLIIPNEARKPLKSNPS